MNNEQRKITRVWIELDRPANDADAERICGFANRMLNRLNGAPPPQRFGWDCKRKQYIYGNEMGYETLVDRGLWFSLDYFGRE